MVPGHLCVTGPIQGFQRQSDGKGWLPLTPQELGERWACLATFFLGLGLGAPDAWNLLPWATGARDSGWSVKPKGPMHWHWSVLVRCARARRWTDHAQAPAASSEGFGLGLGLGAADARLMPLVPRTVGCCCAPGRDSKGLKPGKSGASLWCSFMSPDLCGHGGSGASFVDPSPTEQRELLGACFFWASRVTPQVRCSPIFVGGQRDQEYGIDDRSSRLGGHGAQDAGLQCVCGSRWRTAGENDHATASESEGIVGVLELNKSDVSFEFRWYWWPLASTEVHQLQLGSV